MEWHDDTLIIFCIKEDVVTPRDVVNLESGLLE